MIRFISIYGCLVLFLSYGVLILSGTEGRTWWQDRGFYMPLPPMYEPIVLQKADISSSEPKQFYRSDLQRTGFYDVELKIDLKISSLETVRNLGIHPASKASPRILEDQSIVVTDGSTLAAYETKSDTLQWKLRNFTSPFGFHSTPAVWGDLLIAGDYSGLMVALNRKTGKPFWLLQLGDTFGASPLITENGDIIVSVETKSPDGFIAKIRAQDGKIQWLSSWLGEQSHSSPALSGRAWGGSRIIVVGDNAGFVNGVRDRDGFMLWRYHIGKPIKATPAIRGDVAYVSAWDGNVHAFDVPTGSLLWSKPLKDSNQSSIALMPDGSYGFINSTRGVCRFSLSSQQDLVCEEVEMSRGTRKASPIITRNARKPQQFLVWSPCDRRAFCVFDPQSLKRLNKWDLPSPVSGEPVPFKGTISVMTEEKSGLIEFK